MNHDDEKNPDLQAWIEPELEARLVAAVLGEASAFEQAELKRLAAEKPELAIFQRRIEAVSGLVGLAVLPAEVPLRLAPERREKLLRLFGATPARPSGADKNTPVLLAFAEARRKRRQKWIWFSSFAASLVFAAILGSMVPLWEKPIRPDPSSTVMGPLFEQVSLPVQLPVAEANYDSSNSARIPEQESARAVSRNSAVADLSLAKAKNMFVPSMEKRRSPAAPPPAQLNSGRTSSLKLEDMASSITIVSKQQLQDRAALEINDALKSSADKKAAAAVIGGSARGFTFAEQSIASGKPAAAAAPATISKDQNNTDEALTLSPFEVSLPSDRGYYASNSISGSRTQLSQRKISAANKAAFDRSTGSGAVNSSEASAIFLGDVATEGSKLYASTDFEATVRRAEPAMPAADADLPVIHPPTAAPDASLRAEIATGTQPVSTFSLHVSDVSFRLAQAALARGETPDPERIRPEEFYNAFDYGDPSPSAAEKISSHIEQAAHPLLQQRNLVRIAMKVGSTGRGASQPLHLTVLLDTSGSMEREDRILSVQRALGVLASLLSANDRVTLIGFAQRSRLLVEDLPGNQAAKLAELAAHTPYTGGTNLEEALQLATQLATRHRSAGAQNRIVLITDGAANLGNADPEQLGAKIESLRQQGIAFDACGVGTDGLDDAVLEALTCKGDGRYYLLSTPDDADAGFARKLAGAFRPAAENVKLQVRFNPARVAHYRLIGFEQHRLREEDFRNDKVDAAELAADEAAVALYQVEVLPQGEGELGEVFVRFRDAATSTMVERSWTILHEPHPRAFDRANPTMQLAGIAALLAEKLRGGESAKLIDLAELAPAVNSLRGHYPNDARVQELIAMFEQLRRQSGK